MTRTAQLIIACRDEFEKIEAIDPCLPTYGKICDLLDRADDDTLRLVRDAGIKFISGLARNRCVRRGLS